MRIAICDDEIPILEYLSDNILNSFQKAGCSVTVHPFHKSSDLLKELSVTSFDVIFLDIDMPELNGFQIGEKINSSAKNSTLIFVSNKDEYVFESFRFHPFRFIRKSYFMDEISDVVRDFLQMKRYSDQSITLSSSSQKIQLDIKTIIYVECMDKILSIHTLDETHNIRYRLKDLEIQLAGYGFIRIHKGYLVNYKYIANIKKSGEVILTNGEVLPVSKIRIKQVFEEFASLVK